MAIAFVGTADLYGKALRGGGVLTAIIVVGLVMSVGVIHPRPGGASSFVQHPRRTIPTAWWLFILWGVWLVVEHGLSRPGLQNLLLYVSLLGSIWVAARRTTPGSDRVLAVWLIRAGWLLAGLAATQTLLSGFNSEGLIGRRSFGMVALIAIAVVFAYWQELPRRHRLLGLVLLIEIGVSGSRMSLALALLVIGASTLARTPRPGRLVTRVGLGAAAFLALAVYWTPLRNRFIGGDSGIQVGGLSVNTEGRGAVWELLLRSAAASPWGSGFGASEEATLSATKVIAQPHNDYLRLLVDTGRLGLILWLIGAVTVLWWLARMIRLDPGHRPHHVVAFTTFGTLLGQMVTDNALIYIFIVVPLGALIGMSLAYSRLVPTPAEERRARRKNQLFALQRERTDDYAAKVASSLAT